VGGVGEREQTRQWVRARKQVVWMDRGWGFKMRSGDERVHKSRLAVRTALQSQNTSPAATSVYQRSVSCCIRALCCDWNDARVGEVAESASSS
jgi:hypothetical protein